MAIYWFSCKKCGNAIKKDSSPSNSGCSKASSHDWYRLAEIGDVNYSCKKCGLIIQTKIYPSNSGCSAASSHDWYRL